MGSSSLEEKKKHFTHSYSLMGIVEKIDCEMSDWIEISNCNTTCGEGIKLKQRFVIVSFKNYVHANLNHIVILFHSNIRKMVENYVLGN